MRLMKNYRYKGMDMTSRRSRENNQEEQQPLAEKSNKTCFIVAPIGTEGTDIRRSTEGLLRAVLKPVLGKFDFDVVIAHEISTLGSITEQVVNHLLEADLVVADLSGLNPNVMYELAIRHCAALPVIVIANRNTKLPFDVVVERTIFYSDDMHGGVELARELEKVIIKINENNLPPDNPVTRAKKSESVRQKLMAKEDGGEIDKYFLDRMDKLESLITRSNVFNAENIRKRAGYIDFSTPVKGFSDVIADIHRNFLLFKLPVVSISQDNSLGKRGLDLTVDRELTEEELASVYNILADHGIDRYVIRPSTDL